MNEFFNGEIISLLAVFVSFMATLVLIIVGRRSLMDSKEARLSILDEMIEERKARLGDKGTLEAKVETLSKKRDELQFINQALLNDLDPLREKHSKASLDYEEEKAKLRKLRDDWSDLQDKVELYKKRIEQLNELEEEISVLSTQRNTLQSEVDLLPKVKEELEQLKAERDETLKKIDGLKTEWESKHLKLRKLSKALDDLEKQITEKTEALRTIKKKIAEKAAELENLDQKIIDVSSEIQVQLEKLKGVGQIPEDAFLSLRNPWLEKPKPSIDYADEHEALIKLNTSVEQSGFKLSQRLQYAFHTALKTSDISCLTVMAGVSGTGKSAFPKFYAQAMGIHFLPLAVEPRWDSPQDLFGFLNYMENRYEATTLGRALVQFNNSPFSDEHSTLNNQMLMVLLDEMNLARIEYYFSEFLSKLEMRRNANLDQEEDYKDVSLEIFAGYPADPEKELKECPAIRLFAGKNILFVGTMNEDESTQSLSDKVIDRANVLHFGKPDQLSNIEQNIPRQNISPLSIGAWEKWIKKVDKQNVPDLDKFEQQLNDINTVLADLGRPFGWRTFKAISTYIANYPDQENQKRAMADQIAMRVMPKLRGVDVNEYAAVFNRLKVQLDQINDVALTAAFDDAKNSSMGFFNWRGINWEI
ncbi:MAG: hypothetical protein HQK65_05885 [Desulfamplus sp.]|nr:hypothetical protein [Desulfamplus sp.]